MAPRNTKQSDDIPVSVLVLQSETRHAAAVAPASPACAPGCAPFSLCLRDSASICSSADLYAPRATRPSRDLQAVANAGAAAAAQASPLQQQSVVAWHEYPPLVSDPAPAPPPTSTPPPPPPPVPVVPQQQCIPNAAQVDTSLAVQPGQVGTGPGLVPLGVGGGSGGASCFGSVG